jgi:hypothetical protein
MIHYIVVEGKPNEEFPVTVEKLLNQGWELQGQLIVTPENEYEVRKFTQAMIKNDKTGTGKVDDYSGVTWVDANGIKWQKIRE